MNLNLIQVTSYINDALKHRFYHLFELAANIWSASQSARRLNEDDEELKLVMTILPSYELSRAVSTIPSPDVKCRDWGRLIISPHLHLHLTFYFLPWSLTVHGVRGTS